MKDIKNILAGAQDKLAELGFSGSYTEALEWLEVTDNMADFNKMEVKAMKKMSKEEMATVNNAQETKKEEVTMEELFKKVSKNYGASSMRRNALSFQEMRELNEDMNTLLTMAIDKAEKLAHQYDPFTQYIDNGRQYRQAEARNAEIDKEWEELLGMFGIKAYIGSYANLGSETRSKIEELFTSAFCTDIESVTEKKVKAAHVSINETDKEETAMNTTSTENNATINNASVKEDTIMTTINNTLTAIANTVKEETAMTTTNNIDDMNEVLAALEAKKTSDPAYLNKDAIAEIMKDHYGVELSKREIKNTKREVLVERLTQLINAEFFMSKAEEHAEDEKLTAEFDEQRLEAMQTQVIEVGDLAITKDTAPVAIVTEANNIKKEENIMANANVIGVVGAVVEEPKEVSNETTQRTENVGPNTHSAYVPGLRYQDEHGNAITTPEALDRRIRLVLWNQMAWNSQQNNGAYGFTITSEMLQSMIAKALYGIRNLKKVKEADAKNEAEFKLDKVYMTPERKAKANEMYNWVIKTLLTPVAFKGMVDGKEMKFAYIDSVNGKAVPRTTSVGYKYNIGKWTGQKAENGFHNYLYTANKSFREYVKAQQNNQQ